MEQIYIPREYTYLFLPRYVMPGVLAQDRDSLVQLLCDSSLSAPVVYTENDKHISKELCLKMLDCVKDPENYGRDSIVSFRCNPQYYYDNDYLDKFLYIFPVYTITDQSVEELAKATLQYRYYHTPERHTDNFLPDDICEELIALLKKYWN